MDINGSKPGLVVLLTGLSGAGKSTIATGLAAHIETTFHRKVMLLDGDALRKTISSGLGFSREDRVENIRRAGRVMCEIVQGGNVCVCALIAPYRDARDEVRALVRRTGHFMEVYIDTPLEECERRDPKGLYAKARAGLIQKMTGLDDPYEPPTRPEVTIVTLALTPDEAVKKIVDCMVREGYLMADLGQEGRPTP